VRALTAQANPWGHVHDPALNFVVNEPGVWTVAPHVVACPPARDAAWACVEGTLDEGEGTYSFYVASADAPALPLVAPPFLPSGGDMELPPRVPFMTGHATSWMPGWTLESRALAASDAAVRYHPGTLAAAFPNFERTGWREGIPADQVTFTVLVRAQDGSWRGGALDAWGGRVLGG
jgi:hypothetical protein